MLHQLKVGEAIRLHQVDDEEHEMPNVEEEDQGETYPSK
jgi:hypothetical protein